MILESITLTDYRVFQGAHTFDLAPRIKYGKKRPIVLFGGLNGAGKTSTLTAVRLVLYGRQSIGSGTSQKTYDEHLEKSIHKSRNSLLQSNNASISLTFTYATMGVLKHYTVERNWMINGKKIIENLSISENGKKLSELNQEQCQGFLNELIPIGVSDLFFFDGEKITELAEDTGGLALGDSIKKLLGLDIIDVLNADLTIFARSESKSGATASLQKEITELEKLLQNFEEKAENDLQSWQQLRIQIAEHDVNLDKLENDLSGRGGAWAATREKELTNEAGFRKEKEILEEQLKEIISGNYPISIAASFAKKTLNQLIKENTQAKLETTAQLVRDHLSQIEEKLAKLSMPANLHEKINEIILKEFRKTTEPKEKTFIIHNVTDSILKQIEATIDEAIEVQSHKAKELKKALNEIENQIDKAGKNIARAPEENTIFPFLEKIKKLQEKRAICISKEKGFLESHKKNLREAMEVVRKLDKISQKIIQDEQKNRTLTYANNARSLLKDFSQEMAKRKTKELESEFLASFKRLARKEDLSIRAEINPENFSVMLYSENGHVIEKKDLSKGEKQIYAISILEALGTTSGRKLPIILDTPFARLDSAHRINLIENYFPHASHQVIILSTDTEVDASFYSDLSSDISHAFKLEYDEKSGSTTHSEGYFWKQKQEGAA